MLILVTGGAASGKSAHAEEILCARIGGGKRVYLATMQPFGAAAQERIARHHRLRAGRGFDTVERYTDLAGLTLPQAYDGALLEDLPNLLANESFSPSGAGVAGAVQAVTAGVMALARQVETLTVVTGEIFSDGVDYDADTARYLAQLGEINRTLAAQADAVYESVCGILLAAKEEKR